MSGYDKIIEYAQKIVALSDDERITFSAAFTELRVKKKQFLVQPGFVAKSRFFVIRGALRAYIIDNSGQDNTIQLAIEDWWISDYNSYMFQQPATMFVMAMEDGEVLQISFEEEQKLKAGSHKFETFFRIIAERSAAFMQRRIVTNLTQSAEERYDAFLNRYPLLTGRMPQYVIASYLGMTTEFLSKIRNKKVRKKS